MSFENKVVYQIYPKSFYDSDHDGVGDLQGIIEKLDYLAYIGIDVIWMTPFFVSPQNDNGYDVADYRAIDPRFGTMEIFEQLIKEAKKKNIDIMLDMVFNHTSTKHDWFQKALRKEKKYKDFYIFKKGKQNGGAPTNWSSKFGGSAWEYVKEYDEYYLHLFDKTQADLNWENSEVRDEICNILSFWKSKGVYGFRFDVINLISKPKQFEDDFEGDGRRFYTDGEKVHEYLKEINQRVFGNDGRIIAAGEMSSTSLEKCVKYAGRNAHELSMIFNFHHLKIDYKDKQKWALKPFDFDELKELLFTWQLSMQEEDAWMALFWCNHDQPRAISRFGDDKRYPLESAKMLATVIHCMRGTPFIYQGEEIGMTNAYFHDIRKYRDVESINYYGILKQEGMNVDKIYHILQERSRDNSRTPMQWNDCENAGFSKSTPWIDVIENFKEVNVEASMNNSHSILEYYRQLIKIRKKYEAISKGTFCPILEKHPQILAYKRQFVKEEILVINNFYGTATKIELYEGDYECILSNYSNRQYHSTMELHPYESIVFYKKV